MAMFNTGNLYQKGSNIIALNHIEAGA